MLHIELKRLNVFGQDSTLKSYGIEISMDGTDLGYRNTRAGVILGLSDEEKQRKNASAWFHCGHGLTDSKFIPNYDLENRDYQWWGKTNKRNWSKYGDY